MSRARLTTRAGVTLIELLVVIGIMLFLIGLAALVLPALRQKNNSAKAASQLQGVLSLSKQQAIRDRAPRGVRLIRDPSDANLVRSFQYIEVPDPTRFAPDPSLLFNPRVQVKQMANNDFDNYQVIVSNTMTFDWSQVGAQPGDFLLISKGTKSFFFELWRINGLTAEVKARSGLENLFPSLAQPRTSDYETDFMIVRRARPLVGEQSIQMAPNMAIDLRYSAIAKRQTLPPAPGTTVEYAQLSLPLCLNYGYEGIPPGGTPANGQACLDILFSADGEMLATVTDKIVLFVKPDDGKAGAPTLIAIYARTGAIMLQPVSVNTVPDITTLSPPSLAFDSLFSFTNDGEGSGL